MTDARQVNMDCTEQPQIKLTDNAATTSTTSQLRKGDNVDIKVMPQGSLSESQRLLQKRIEDLRKRLTNPINLSTSNSGGYNLRYSSGFNPRYDNGYNPRYNNDYNPRFNNGYNPRYRNPSSNAMGFSAGHNGRYNTSYGEDSDSDLDDVMTWPDNEYDDDFKDVADMIN